MIVITPPERQYVEDVARDIIDVVRSCICKVHLRIPGASETDFRQVLDSLEPAYHQHIVLCDHYALLAEYDVAGVYLPYRRVAEWRDIPLAPLQTIAVGAHSIQELLELPFTPDYALLSPLFDSISKEGYQGNPALLSCREELLKLPYPVYALGGITPEQQETVAKAGYAGVAVLGDIWSQPQEQRQERLDQYQTPAILTVAGHDPTSGAGISVDTRIANDLRVQCYSVISTLTAQNLHRFVSATATPSDQLQTSLTTLLTDHPVTVAKLGMVQDLQQAVQIVALMKALGVRRIIWDPILQPTAAKETQLHLWTEEQDQLATLLNEVSLVTPNTPEAQALFGTDDPAKLQRIAQKHGVSILLKGGHDTTSPHLVVNHLITSDGIHPRYAHRYDKSIHGTGCMLSAAIASYWAMEYSLVSSVQRACHYLATIFAGQPNLPGRQLLCPKIFREDRKKEHLYTHFALQYVTNESDPDRLYNKVSQYLEAGGRWVQLRLKEATTEERIEMGLRLRTLTDRYNACLLIDDDIIATIAVDADGVHLGKRDCPPQEARRTLGDDYIIGYTVNSLDDLPRAMVADIDYIGVGPYRDTRTKALLAPILGLEGISQIAQQVQETDRCYTTPQVVAIGGIQPEDAETLLGNEDIDGIAVSGAIEHATDMAHTVSQLQCGTSNYPR